MKKWLVFGFLDCKDPAREAEFIQWYSQVRHPDLMKRVKLKSARLFKNARPGPGQRRLLSAYEVETDDIAPVLSRLAREVVRLDHTGRGSELLDLHEGGVFEEISRIDSADTPGDTPPEARSGPL